MFNSIAEIVKVDDLTATTSAPLYTPGVVHKGSGNSYVYVYNAAASTAIATGKYASLDVNGGTSFTSGYSVSVSAASLAGVLVGVAQSTISTGHYGWLMYNGVSLVSPDSGEVSANAGVYLALGTDGGFIAAGATFSTASRVGITLNSFITGATSKARLFGSIIA